MILILAALAAAQPVAGCISIGSALHCDLAPIAATPVALSIDSAATPPRPAERPAAIGERRSRRKAVARSRPAAGDDAAALPAAGLVAAHIESLVSIGDCTGARTYARLIGDANLADQAFARCVAPPAAQISAAR